MTAPETLDAIIAGTKELAATIDTITAARAAWDDVDRAWMQFGVAS